MVSAGVYDSPQLTQTDLKLLYPPDNLYRNQLTLAVHLTASLLVEKMEWEGDTAVGETAFWLKVLSVPAIKDHQIDKIRFKRRVFSAWKSKDAKVSQSTSFSNTAQDSQSRSEVVATPIPDKIPPRSETASVASVSKRMYDTDEQVPEEADQQVSVKRPKTIFEPKSPHKNLAPKKDLHDKTSIDSDISTDYEEGGDNSIHEALNDTTGLTAEEWAILEASITDVIERPKAGVSGKNTSPKKDKKPPAFNSAKRTTSAVVEKVLSTELQFTTNNKPKPASRPGPHARSANKTERFRDKHNNVTVRPNVTSEKLEALKLMACPHCDFRAINRKELDGHKFTDHADDIYVIPCTVEGCTYRAKQNWLMKNHMISGHGEEKAFKCSQCDKRFKTKTELTKHNRSVHEKAMWSCSLCDFQVDATNRNHRYRHMAKAHEDYSKVFRCTYEGCSYFALLSGLLTSHINVTHEKAIKYNCGIGDCMFSSLSQIVTYSHRQYAHGDSTKHINSKHRSLSMKINVVHKFYCSECKVPFRTRKNIDHHIAQCHADNTAEAVPTNAVEAGQLTHTCSECQHALEDYAALLTHIKVSHDGNGTVKTVYDTDPKYRSPEISIKCSHCDFIAVHWAGMKSHIRAQHENKIYKCEQCDYIGQSRHGFTNHTLKKHNPNHPKRKRKRKGNASNSGNLSGQIPETTATTETIITDAAAPQQADLNNRPVTPNDHVTM